MALKKIIDDLCHPVKVLDAISPPLRTRRKSSFQLSPIASRKTRLRKIKLAVRKQPQLPAAQFLSHRRVDRWLGQGFRLKQQLVQESFWPAVKLARSKAILLEKQYQKAFPIGWCTCFEQVGRSFEEKRKGCCGVWCQISIQLWRMVFRFLSHAVWDDIQRSGSHCSARKHYKETNGSTQTDSR